MQSTQALISPETPSAQINPPLNLLKGSLPDHTQLPESDGTFVENFQEHPQSIILTSSIEPILQKLHPDGRYCIGQDSGIYWRSSEPAEKGAEAPDWFYVPNVPPLLDGEYRRSYVLWKEFIAPLITIEFVSGNGSEERDATPPGEADKVGKFWVYEQAIRIPFYAIFEAKKALVEVYHLVDGSYEQLPPNDRNHYPIAPMGVELGIKEDGGIPWLRWWNKAGDLLLTGDERAMEAEQKQQQAETRQQQAEQKQQQAEARQQQAEQKAARLAEKLRALGIDPEETGND